MKSLLTTIPGILCCWLLHAQPVSYELFVASEQSQDRQNNSWAMKQPYVILISIDGFRYDYAKKYKARNILRLAEQGASAEKMLPSFPSKTFPNHYTLVTGLWPGHHGIVSNEFYSRSRQEWYRVADRNAVQDGSWYGGVPLWSLAEQQGMLSASLFWVGSEAEIAGTKPSYYHVYDGSIPNEYRTRRVVEWLRLPEQNRPHAIFTYFSLVDDAGHRYGPDHDETRAAVLEIDELIGELVSELKRIDLPVHLVLVSDHGMAAISRGIVLSEFLGTDALVSYSIPAMIYESDPAKKNELYKNFLEVSHLDVYLSENLPAYLNYQNQDRVGDLVLIPAAPTITMKNPAPVHGGTHGFDPYANGDMGAVFYASGPEIVQGMVVPPFENIHLYPFLAEILNLEIAEPVDGKIEVLRPVLKQ